MRLSPAFYPRHASPQALTAPQRRTPCRRRCARRSTRPSPRRSRRPARRARPSPSFGRRGSPTRTRTASPASSRRPPATPEMRYSIGSISKQFTAAAILMLAEEGKLSLDDKVERWLPGLTRANDVTMRQLLSMTSGYQDYWPQDYVMPAMLKPVDARTRSSTAGRRSRSTSSRARSGSTATRTTSSPA